MKKLLWLAMCLVTGNAYAQSAVRYDGNVTTASTAVAPGAQAPVYTVPNAFVTVCTYPGSPDADVCANVTPIYADQAMMQQLSQPIQADGAGRFGFWAPAGNYSYSVQSARGTYLNTYTLNLSAPVTLPTLAKVAYTGQASDLQGYGNNAIISGTDLGAQACAVAASWVGVAGVLHVYAPNQAVLTNCTLPSNVKLHFHAPASFKASFVPTVGNSVQCDGAAAVLTDSGIPNIVPSNGVDPLYGPFFAAPLGAAEVKKFEASGCDFESVTGLPAEVFGSVGPVQDVDIHNNLAHNVALYKQSSAPATNPSLRVSVRDNNNPWDSTANQDAASVLAYGAIQQPSVQNNIFVNGSSGMELYNVSGAGNQGSTNPTPADIIAGGTKDVLFSGNNCSGMSATCAWTSVASGVHFNNNIADGCGDVCFDFEATVDSAMDGDSATGGGNGDFSTFFTARGLSFSGLHIKSRGEPGFILKNAGGYAGISSGTKIQNIDFSMTTGTVGVFIYSELTDHLEVTGSNVTDGLMAYNTYISSELIAHNHLLFDAPIPGSNIGSATGAGFGISLGNFQDSTFAIADGNDIVTTVAQAQACIGAGISQPNTTETVKVLRNSCEGPWSADATVTNSSSNVATGQNFLFRWNQFATGTINTNSTYGAPVNVIRTDNFVGTSTSAN